jgi:ABC-type microcin C transport system permease subunit YejB
MILFLLKRLATLLATLAVASLVVFAVLELLPGNAAEVILGDTATPESLAALEPSSGWTGRRCSAMASGSAACCRAARPSASATTRRPPS